MRDKRLIAIEIIAGGIVLGIFLSFILPSKPKVSPSTSPLESGTSPISQTANEAGQKPNILAQADLRVDRTSLRAGGAEKDYSKIEKAIITVHYKNNTSSDLDTPKIWLKVTGTADYEVAGFPTNPINIPLTQANSAFRIFDAPSVKPGEEQTANIYFFGKHPGTTTISAEVKSSSVQASTNTVTVTFN